MKKMSPTVDYVEAKRLATEVFPKIQNSSDVCLKLRIFAKREGYAEGTFRRKYYQWRRAVDEDRSNDGACAIVDLRLVRGLIVSSDTFFKDVLATYEKRKNFAIAYRETYRRYESLGMVPPQGSSLVNLRRYLKRAQGLPSNEIDSEKCRNCQRTMTSCISHLDALLHIQKECRNCDRLL